MPIELEVMRALVLEALRDVSKTQYENFKYDVARVALTRQLPVGGMAQQPYLLREDMRRYREVIWALVIEGVLAIGMDDANAAWPWFSLTEYGEECVRASKSLPHDPAGYLRRVAESGPLDDVESRYIAQALAAYNRNLPDAAAVMLGAASEHLVDVLAGAIASHDPAIQTKMHKLQQGPALPLLRGVVSYLEQNRPKLSRRLSETLDTTFAGVASIIRISRNDGGHPALPIVDREAVFVHLQLFASYREWVKQLIAALPL